MTELRFSLSTTVLSASDPKGLAAFYRDLLGWQITSEDDDWLVVRDGDADRGLAFQLEEHHARPSWPTETGEQQMQMHLDVRVSDLTAGVARAESLGATQAAWQPQDDVRVMIDPEGHPFCLFEN